MVGFTSKEDHKWSDKKKGGDEGFNTVECLRGRLLAERQASKVANEEAESICNKLIELEKKLREEIKLRERAERRLKFLKKKLASFNISGESSQKCQNCCTTPTTRQTKPHTTNPRFSEGSMHKFSEDRDTQGEPYCHFPQNLCENSDPNSEYLKSDESRLSISSSKSSTEDSIALSTHDSSSNSTNPGDSSLEYHTHNPNPSSNNVKNEESRLKIMSKRENDDGSVIEVVDALIQNAKELLLDQWEQQGTWLLHRDSNKSAK